MRYVDAAAIAAFGPAAAVQVVREALLGGLDPAADPGRVAVGMASGQLLLMPAQAGGSAGVKVAAVAPDNPERGLPRIQATYLLLDGDTLALRAVLDGTALTTLRTPAVSVAAVLDHLPDRPLRVVAFGAGPQAVGHVATLAAVRRVDVATHVVRQPARVDLDAVAAGSAAAAEAVRAADVVVLATSASEPVLAADLVPDTATVIAVGSHEPHVREVGGDLVARATVVVEDVETALREAGDVVLAIEEEALERGDLVALADVVGGRARVPSGRPLLFKSVGMAWEDLVVATAVAGAQELEQSDGIRCEGVTARPDPLLTAVERDNIRSVGETNG